MNFKKWLELQEMGTGTNAIASYSRPIFNAPVRRGEQMLKNSATKEPKIRR
jgi:hypothetical protein